MKKTLAAALAVGLLLTFPLTGCGAKPKAAQTPVTLTMWHNFGGDMQTTMDALIDEFNGTVGKERGIIINVTAITSSAELQEALGMIVNGDPGAPAMPDLTTGYPKTAVLFQEKGMLADLDGYFSKEELDAYVPAFVEEGRLGDGGLYVFPFAKSTEILYLNQTLFDRFSAATGVGMDSLATFEGIAGAARAYYDWTDAQTPDVPNDGKQFYAADSWGNLAQAGALQLGSSLFDGEKLDLSTEAFRHVWETCYAPAVEGGFAVYDGYSSDLSKTGDLVCSTGSSAGILFYGDTITYPDNTVEEVEYSILPYPVFEGGEKWAIQRGNGFLVASSDPEREEACAVFLKWFTSPAQNMRFIASTGYLPVTNEAFVEQMPAQMEQVGDARIKRMLEAVTEMHAEYEFFVAPAFAGYDSLSKSFEKDYKAALAKERDEFAGGRPASAGPALEAFAAAH